MKIKRVFLKEYKNLKDFEINFQSKSNISVIIGKNGAGKSNFIEALVIIFKYLYLETEKTPFLDFEIEYTCSGFEVKIEGFSTFNSRKQGYEIIVNNSKISLSNFRNDIKSKGSKYLPDSIILYYSGFNNRLESVSKRFEEDFKIQISNNDKDITGRQRELSRSIFYVKSVHNQFMLLSLFSSDLEDANKFIKNKLKLTELKKVAIYLKKPSWAKQDGTIENFWGASNGAVLQLLNLIKENSKIERAIDGEYYFLIETKVLNTLRKIRNIIGYERDLFFRLDAAYLNDIITRISLGFGNPDNKFLTWSDNLSEGEHQLVTTKVLTDFIGTNDSLFLFDEPDTYLHPEWQRSFIPEIENSGRDTQFIITTHSPQFLSSLHEDNIIVLQDGRQFSLDSNGLYGRDTNSILEEVLDTVEMSPDAKQLIEEFNIALANKDLDSAIRLRDKIKIFLSVKDPFYAVSEMRIERLKRNLE